MRDGQRAMEEMEEALHAKSGCGYEHEHEERTSGTRLFACLAIPSIASSLCHLV